MSEVNPPIAEVFWIDFGGSFFDSTGEIQSPNNSYFSSNPFFPSSLLSQASGLETKSQAFSIPHLKQNLFI